MQEKIQTYKGVILIKLKPNDKLFIGIISGCKTWRGKRGNLIVYNFKIKYVKLQR